MNEQPQQRQRKERQKTVRMSVSIRIPEGCDESDVIEYAVEALGTWCKSYYPGDSDFEPDPRFDINDGITIRHKGAIVS